MASGILGQSAPSATTDTNIYQVPSATTAVVNINILNRGAAVATVRIALTDTTTPGDDEYIEYDATVPPKGVLERTGIALNAGKYVMVYASTSDTSVNVYGLETAV